MDSIYPVVIISSALVFFGLIIITKLLRLSTNILFLGLFGTIVGLLIGSLASSSLTRLPGQYGTWIPIIITSISVFGTLTLFLSKKDLILATFEGFSKIFKLMATLNPKTHSNNYNIEMVVDTSVLIDGRILDITKTGFITGSLIVPRFVLKELQNIADSEVATRREKGRRGLELLNSIKKKTRVKVVLTDEDYSEIEEVDLKLVQVAKKRGAYLLTTDYNLNKVAKVDGVDVLNINELANAVKPMLVPGEEIEVKVIQSGKEQGQGVAYLPDGTMIVVEGGDKLVGKKISVEIKRIFQTDAGKMFFAIPVLSQQKNKIKK